MEEFRKYFRAWYEVCRDGQEFSEQGKAILRKLYDAVPKEIDFARFMDAFMMRPTFNIDASEEWMMAWLEDEMRKVS